MKEEEQLYTLEFLLGFDGHVHWLDQGYRLKFEIKRVKPTKERPHGLRYSFTLHHPDGKRLMGFDNAHGVPAKGSRYNKRQAAADHWHRTEDDEGRPYSFTTAEATFRTRRPPILFPPPRNPQPSAGHPAPKAAVYRRAGEDPRTSRIQSH